VLHISIWGIEAVSGGLSGDGTEFWAPCDSEPPPVGGMECGWYGSGYTYTYRDRLLDCRVWELESMSMSNIWNVWYGGHVLK